MSIAALAFASFGAAVVAAPMVMTPKDHVARTEMASLAPLASGPAIQLAHAGPGESEDCVRVTRMTGPDGKEYPTNGIVCSGK
jgi:hypothetical protein